MRKEVLHRLAKENNSACLSISLNTHRTFPENIQDGILLKNLCVQAEERIIAEFGKRPVAGLLEKLSTLTSETDTNYLLDSLHVFISNDTLEIVKSIWPVVENTVQISDQFALRHLINEYNRSTPYLILLLSQKGVHVYEATNDSIESEVLNEDFPFSENPHYHTDADKGSDAKSADNFVREFLNKVDKALVRLHHETELPCIVICTEDNYARLQQVADKPDVYLGYMAVDYNDIRPQTLAEQAWLIIQKNQETGIQKAEEELMQGISQGKVLTDLQEIFQAAQEGRADLLMVDPEYRQAVKMLDDRRFELIPESERAGVVDDVVSNIAWDVISKKGRVVFAPQMKSSTLGRIALKLRY
jgi:hypothetical protein